MDKLTVGSFDIDYEMVDDDSLPISVGRDRLDYDIPYVISGMPGVQLCVIHIDDTKYSILITGIPMDHTTGGVTISMDGGPDYRDDWEKCPYCGGTGVHLHEDNDKLSYYYMEGVFTGLYWLCRNCQTHGYVKNTGLIDKETF